ncbi:flagellar biosynthesis protein FlgA [Aminobacter sp. DSM 101952]|uniref:NAD(P)H-dependent oxidoreductase n=1 Tax=Aminobacter sp. DSM 101952 TaxID=2735891 RepID=UPI0006FB246F|nr:Gfo/Idh/MocA family oxidoreductase [Aminobacter sp. DSM 101952]KQU74200.1 flagellar biosynthesis protein FlgA [Aminobacter sp. DSM 101952]
MNLHAKLRALETQGRSIRIGLVGAGKFGSMFVSQCLRTPGLQLVAIADISLANAEAAITVTGHPKEMICRRGIEDAVREERVGVTEDPLDLISSPFVDIVVEATGDPVAGAMHALECFRFRKHVLMVNVEADALVGPALAREAERAGVIYSLAYGDQPALICEMVDWARTAGLNVVAAGKGTKHRLHYHASTPETVWDHYNLTPEQARLGRLNPKMFNSFLDGTKSALEMAAVANATGLDAPVDGLRFPACGVEDLAELLKPIAGEGGGAGRVEVVSSMFDDGSEVPRHLRWGVFTVFEAPSAYVARCFSEYGLTTDASGRFACMYKPFHLIGLELGISVASMAIRHEPTGAPTRFRADVVAVAKRDLAVGEVLDGEGGFCVWGKLTTSARSIEMGYLPVALASNVRLKSPVAQGSKLRWSDIEVPMRSPVIELRQKMERASRANEACGELPGADVKAVSIGGIR